jgi:3-hydroxy-9,10-secoandrosta-1,3,5(10)-triene-9,17-dione monooxygenase
MPSTDYDVSQTWDTAAMRATGSNTIVANDVFVPSSYALRFSDLRDGTGPGAALHAAHRYRLPLVSYAPLAFAVPMLGAAQGAYEQMREWLESRTTPVGTPVRETGAVQVALGRVAADLDAADLVLRRICTVAEEVEQPTYELRARAMRDYSWATVTIVGAIDALVEMGGSSAFARTSPLQRAWRDIHFMASHVSLNRGANFGHWGRAALGVELPATQPFF